MIAIPLSRIDAARVVRGDPRATVSSLAVDSRLVEPGALFVPVRGARHDGHDFLADACAARAAAVALAEPRRSQAPHGVALLEGEPLPVLASAARAVRSASRASFVAIAGAAGKTTTKDVLRDLCRPHLRTVASPESFNNEIGVPLTLAEVEPETELAVCELGTGGAGEVASLAAVIRPQVGVLTAVGAEHLESLGSVEAAVAAEAELIGALAPGATVVVPAGERRLEPYLRADLRRLTFGMRGGDVRLLAASEADGATEAVLGVGRRRVGLRTNLWAPFQLRCLCAAVAAYAALGLPLAHVAQGARRIELSGRRGELRRRRGGGVLVQDAYNANPVSMTAALEALATRRNGGRLVAVLGEMAELGPESPAWHAAVGEAAARAGVDLVVAVGPHSRGYLDGGEVDGHWFPNVAAAAAALPSLLRGRDAVLLKGSRSARLERLEPALL